MRSLRPTWLQLVALIAVAASCGRTDPFDESQQDVIVDRPDAPDFQRTVIFIYAETRPGQDLFIRGGLDHGQARDLLGLTCTNTNYACAIPIRHLNWRNATTRSWKNGDDYLDWYGREAHQNGSSHGIAAEGTAADWTTDYWPRHWGTMRSVETDGYGVEPLNRFGMHYWMLDVEMDCSRTYPVGDERWFEFKSYVSGGPGWERNVRQADAPYRSGNHFGQCGRVNIFRRDQAEAHVLPFGIEPAPYILGAGDIAYSNDGKDRTAGLLDEFGPGAAAIFTAGDNIQGSPLSVDEARWEYDQWFEPSWGRHKANIHPAPGNHDYWVGDGQAYYEYFGEIAGDPAQGYYAYDVGDRWHVVVLNSNLAWDASRQAEQLEWLRQDLASRRSRHMLAIWHQPRFSSGEHGSSTSMQAAWDVLMQFGAEIVLSGHDHHYERFAPQDAMGQRDDARGIRQFVLGTGGMTYRSIPWVQPNSEVRQTGTWGLLRLTLHPSWYEWVFLPVEGGTFVDTGSTFCH